MNDSELANTARGVARCLSYNDDKHQSAAKHLLREMAHRLDSKNIRARGFRTWNVIGKSRRMTVRELLAFWMFRILPTRV